MAVLAFDLTFELEHKFHPLLVVDLTITVSIAIAEKVLELAVLKALADEGEGALELLLVQNSIAVLIEPVERVLEQLSKVLLEVFLSLHTAHKLSLHKVQEVVHAHLATIAVGELVHNTLQLLCGWLLTEHSENLVELDSSEESIGRLTGEHLVGSYAFISDFLP